MFGLTVERCFNPSSRGIRALGTSPVAGVTKVLGARSTSKWAPQTSKSSLFLTHGPMCLFYFFLAIVYSFSLTRLGPWDFVLG